MQAALTDLWLTPDDLGMKQILCTLLLLSALPAWSRTWSCTDLSGADSEALILQSKSGWLRKLAVRYLGRYEHFALESQGWRGDVQIYTLKNLDGTLPSEIAELQYRPVRREAEIFYLEPQINRMYQCRPKGRCLKPERTRHDLSGIDAEFFQLSQRPNTDTRTRTHLRRFSCALAFRSPLFFLLSLRRLH